MLAAGLLATPQYVSEVYGQETSVRNYGAFYGGNGYLFACQVIEVAVLSAWTFVLMGGFFWIMRVGAREHSGRGKPSSAPSTPSRASSSGRQPP